MNKQQLASKIWESANKMRSKIEANEYKDYILGFIFYKFLSNKELEFLKKEKWTKEDLIYLTEEDSETVEHIQKNLGYFISYENLFSTWLEKNDFNVGNVRDALSAFNRLISENYEKVFSKIFDTLQTGLSKLGDTSGKQTKAINELLKLIKDIPMDGKQDYDVLGFIYEYLISNFAANAGKKAGEFYTPHEVSQVMSEIVAYHLKDNDKIEIYDPTSGSGSLLINIGKSVAKHINNKNNIKFYAQELKQNTYNLTRMNLVMRGILPDNIVTRCGDTLEDDWPFFEDNDKETTYRFLQVDAVVSNPPYSQNWDPTNKEGDQRYKGYGIAPKSKADYAFLLHDLYHIKPSGIMTIVLPHGVLFRGGEEEKIRKNLIENNNIDAIIGLPANIFFGTGIPTIIMVLKQKGKGKNTDVLIVDASKGFAKKGKNNVLQASDIKKIADTVNNRKTIDKFSRVVTRDEIRQNEYNLNIPRYVDSSEKAESWDIYASIFGGIPNTEINELNKYWNAFPNLKNKLFNCDGSPYSTVSTEDLTNSIKNDESVVDFINKYNTSFSNFNDYLTNELINNMTKVEISKEENKISLEIFEKVKNFDLIDKYKAYQLLDDNWQIIENDLEIIQTEGYDSIKKIDPNMVIKKVKGKEAEVQEGYKGHILPFELVQNIMQKDEVESIKNKENLLANIASDFDEILESLNEEEKESNCLNDEKTAFVNKEIIKQAKILQKAKLGYAEESFEFKVIKIDKLIAKEKKLGKEIREEKIILIEKTMDIITNLTSEQITMLLNAKWVKPLVNSIKEMPQTLINNLVSKINKLAEKYENTYLDIKKDINQTDKELSTMIDDLTGSEFDMKGLKEFQNLLKGE